jgi:hypothetical protein
MLKFSTKNKFQKYYVCEGKYKWQGRPQCNRYTPCLEKGQFFGKKTGRLRNS